MTDVGVDKSGSVYTVTFRGNLAGISETNPARIQIFSTETGCFS